MYSLKSRLRGLGFTGFREFRGLGFRGLGFRGLGFRTPCCGISTC